MFWLVMRILISASSSQVTRFLLKEPKNCVSPCSLKFSSTIFFPFCPYFYEHLIFLSSTGFYLLIFLYFGVFSIEEKLQKFCVLFVQHSTLLKKSGLLYSWRKVPYELKSNFWYSRKTSDIQGNTSLKSL